MTPEAVQEQISDLRTQLSALRSAVDGMSRCLTAAMPKSDATVEQTFGHPWTGRMPPLPDSVQAAASASADWIAEIAAAVVRADNLKVERDALRTENKRLKAALKKAADCLYDLASEMECDDA